MLLAAVAASASAQPAAGRQVAPGMTTPAGIAVTPDGELWVSDAVYGLCRVTTSGLAMDEFCAPEPLEPPVPPATPVAETRPGATGQIAFDALTDNFYVAEGTSAGSGVWRMHRNPDTHAIDVATKIFESGADRVQGLALTGSGAVVFSDKTTSRIRRLATPDEIVTAQTFAPNVGASMGAGSASLAALGETIYIADGGTLTKLEPATGTGVAVPVDGQAAPVEGVDTGIAAVAADPARGVVFAGTATPDLTDSVLSAQGDVMSPAAYDRGYTNITAMTVDADGGLYVVQDPNGALSPSTDPTGQAQLYRKPLGPLVAPEVVLTTKPLPVTQDATPAFAFGASGGTDATRFECAIDGTPVECVATGTTGTYVQPADTPLAEGRHTFSVRATNVPDATADDWGPERTHAFRVDRTAPTVTIDDPSSHTAVGGKLRLYFSADEAGVAFTCRVDDGPAIGCDAPRDFTLAQGEHTITVRATDDALNTSAPVTWHVTAVPGPPAPAAPVSRRQTTVDPGPALPAPIAAVAQPRAPRIEIGVACVEVSASRAAARFSLAGRNAIVRFRAPAAARYAKFTLRRASANRRRANVVETLAYARVARAGAAHTTRIALTRGERRLVRSGTTRLAVSYGTCRTQVGQFQWIASSTEGNR